MTAEADDYDRRTESRIAAAVTVAAMVPIEIGTKRSVGPLPDDRQKATAPSTSEGTGSTAGATPPLAILATREQPALSSAASVITQTSVVLRSSSLVQSGGPSIAAISLAVDSSSSPCSPRGPASTRPSCPITSPNALTTASAATVSPRPLRAAAYPTPAGTERSRPRIFPTAAPVPAPTRPRFGSPAAADAQAA